MNGYTKEFLSIEQALKGIIEDLKELEIDFDKEIGRNIKYLRRCADENPEAGDRNLDLKDAIKIDKVLLNKEKGNPLFDLYNIHIQKHVKSLHQESEKSDIKNLLLDINSACSKLTNIVRLSKDPSSEMGEKISNREKEEIYFAIKDIEKQISSIKIYVGEE